MNVTAQTPSEERKAAKRAEARQHREAEVKAQEERRKELRKAAELKPPTELWTAQQCAEFLNVATSTWFSYVHRPGKINPAPQPLHKVGWSPLWDPEEVQEYAKNRRRPIKS